MKKIITVLALLFWAVTPFVLLAQTVTVGPVTTTNKFAWNAPVNLTATDLPTFEVRLRDAKSPAVVTALTNVQCSGTPITCTSQLTLSNVDALNMVGVHNITLSYFRSDLPESPQSTPFTLTSPSLAPTGLRVIQ